MTSTPNNPTPPGAQGGTSAAGSGQASSGSASAADTEPASESASDPSPAASPPTGVPRLPSMRVAAVLAAGMLGLGVAVGAAIGPAPNVSFAGSSLVPSLAAIATGSAAQQGTTSATAPPPASTQATPTPPATPSPASSASSSVAASTPTPSSTTTPSRSTTPTKNSEGSKQTTLPPVTSVWLIELSGSTFTQALAQPTSAPYIDSELVPASTLLSGWSAIDGSALASEAPLLSGKPPQLLDTIVQPPCPEGAAGAPCAPETAGAVSAADTFLKQTVPTITSSATYRERGLIVVTFGAVANPTASGLPAGAATATLSAEPPAGVLALSPHVRAGVRSSSVFDPTSPRRSLERLLH